VRVLEENWQESMLAGNLRKIGHTAWKRRPSQNEVHVALAAGGRRTASESIAAS
jgi:hypothetical protein